MQPGICSGNPSGSPPGGRWFKSNPRHQLRIRRAAGFRGPFSFQFSRKWPLLVPLPRNSCLLPSVPLIAPPPFTCIIMARSWAYGSPPYAVNASLPSAAASLVCGSPPMRRPRTNRFVQPSIQAGFVPETAPNLLTFLTSGSIFGEGSLAEPEM